MSLEGESGSNGGRLAGEKTLAADWTIGVLAGLWHGQQTTLAWAGDPGELVG